MSKAASRLSKFKLSKIEALLLLTPLFAFGHPTQAQSILPPRPEAINGGNPLEGLGRADDPNPSRASDFPDLNTTTPTPTPDANAPTNSTLFPANTQGDPPQAGDAPRDPNLPPIDPNAPQASAPGAGDNPNAAGNTPGAAEALLKAQQLAKEEGVKEEGVIDPAEQKPGLLPEADGEKASANRNEASFFKVVADSPIRGTLVDIREGRYEAALTQLKSMYARTPSAIELQYLMGVSSVMLRRNQEAEQHYQRVLHDKLAPMRLKQLAQKGLDKIKSN